MIKKLYRILQSAGICKLVSVVHTFKSRTVILLWNLGPTSVLIEFNLTDMKSFILRLIGAVLKKKKYESHTRQILQVNSLQRETVHEIRYTPLDKTIKFIIIRLVSCSVQSFCIKTQCKISSR